VELNEEREESELLEKIERKSLHQESITVNEEESVIE